MYRARLDGLVFPLQYAVDLPIRGVRLVISTLQHQRELLIENANLRAHQFILEAKLQKLLALERENAELKSLLQSSDEAKNKVLAARLLAVDLASGLQQVILDRGHAMGIYIGQPVVDAHGVVGQVVAVGSLTSKVLLLTDKRSAIPVQNYRNGVRSVAVGSGFSGSLQLVHVTATSDIKEGDLFVTSGLGLRFPAGYPVGVVTHYEPSVGQDFARVILKPAAHMDTDQQVLLVWPRKEDLRAIVDDQLKQPLPSVSESPP